MKRVMNSVIKTKQIENRRIGILRMELDYELATLHDAIRNNDDDVKKECLQKLEKIRKELIKLGEFQ
ncbi:hypothetical protein [Bacillus massiliigorillae]|uniref:hypothetical protein n=1 Tax=Bacillus massiliigorillae TaxID=1243664 RepID=UPI0003A0E2DD|nr:hypothetical protein [Bacillus massiliigorillae]